jgi:hypothetical protein
MSRPALERVAGLRVVAQPAALDGARWVGLADREVTVLRVAPDEAIAIDALEVDVPDEHAIVVEEHGFVVARCALAELERHVEWPISTTRPAFIQGAVAGVPAKLILNEDGTADLYAAAAYAHELAARLGWRT